MRRSVSVGTYKVKSGDVLAANAMHPLILDRNPPTALTANGGIRRQLVGSVTSVDVEYLLFTEWTLQAVLALVALYCERAEYGN